MPDTSTKTIATQLVEQWINRLVVQSEYILIMVLVMLVNTPVQRIIYNPQSLYTQTCMNEKLIGDQLDTPPPPDSSGKERVGAPTPLSQPPAVPTGTINRSTERSREGSVETPFIQTDRSEPRDQTASSQFENEIAMRVYCSQTHINT